MDVPYVAIGQQFVADREEIFRAIDEALSGGDCILGPAVQTFEKAFASVVGAKHAFGVANGTEAISIALKCVGVGPGDEVITAPNSWVSSASAVALIGARPVFADTLPDFTIDPFEVEKRITSKTKAILPVHLTGRCADMDALRRVAERHSIAVVEDAAQCIGATYKGTPAGALGDLACFSLHPLKNLSCLGDGGVITTNSDDHATRVGLFRNHGLVGRGEISQWGYNSRLDTLQAAVLNVRLAKLHGVTETRRRYAAMYRHGLAGVVELPHETADRDDVYHLFMIRVPRRDELVVHLKNKGISTAIHYPVPLHLQAPCREYGYQRGDFPNTERDAARILSLPIHQLLAAEQIEFVISEVRTFMGAS